MKPLAFTGKVIETSPIDGADFIHSVTVVCGEGGKWRGVARKDINVGDTVVVFLQDAVLPPDDPRFEFMKSSGYRVKMRRFKGAPSECLVMPNDSGVNTIGTDVTELYRVTKYEKVLPAGMSGDIVAPFPTHLCPMTDEVNYQTVPELVAMMDSDPFYVTQKVDGTSCTAWVDYDGKLHVCSRRYELKEFDAHGKTNVYWEVARKYDLGRLPPNLFFQFEIAGPGIQKNPLGLKEREMFLFSVYDGNNSRYLPFVEDCDLCRKYSVPIITVDFWAKKYSLPMVKVCEVSNTGLGYIPSTESLTKMAEIKYPNGRDGEGIVIRALDSEWSFKVINLLYKD